MSTSLAVEQGKPSYVPGFYERYFDRYTEEPTSGCWLWHASQISAGYGNFTFEGETIYAHRASFEATHGAGSAIGVVVRHRCDNPPCINPDHLIPGAQVDNVEDAWRRGRMHPIFGEEHVRAVLTEADVLTMRKMAADGAFLCDIADLFPVNRNAAEAAITGTSWAHLPGAVPLSAMKKKPSRGSPLRGSDKPQAILHESAVREIKAAIRGGSSPRKTLAAIYGVSISTIHAIASERIWAHVH